MQPAAAATRVRKNVPAQRRFWFLTILLLGLAVRVFLFNYRHDYRNIEHAEMAQIAHSLVTHGTFSDPFGGPTGPTAHEMPLYPMFLALLERVAGSEVRAQYLLELCASLASSLQYAMLPLLAIEIGLPLMAGAIAGLLGAALPLHYWLETKGSWDAPFTALCLAWITWRVLTYLNSGVFTPRRAIWLGLIGGVGTLLTTSVLPVVVGFIAILLIRVHEQGRTLYPALLAALLAAAMLALVLSPWVVRNTLVFGKLIPFRSNLGMELDLFNHDGAKPDLSENIASDYYRQNHPLFSAAARKHIQQVGEVEYGRERMTKAKAWISTHASRFVWLSVQRVMYFWFPLADRWWQTVLTLGVRILAFAGLALLWRHNKWLGILFAWLWFAFSAVYYLVAIDVPRHAYPLWWSQVLLACYILTFAWAKMKQTGASIGH